MLCTKPQKWINLRQVGVDYMNFSLQDIAKVSQAASSPLMCGSSIVELSINFGLFQSFNLV